MTSIENLGGGVQGNGPEPSRSLRFSSEEMRDRSEFVPKYFAVVGACYLVATNGMAHYACRIELEAGSYVFLNDLSFLRGSASWKGVTLRKRTKLNVLTASS